jgi:hypothetical protein
VLADARDEAGAVEAQRVEIEGEAHRIASPRARQVAFTS